ncbi:hypothetical protein GCM10027597_26280 [Saccharopolyspora tripterygii]
MPGGLGLIAVAAVDVSTSAVGDPIDLLHIWVDHVAGPAGGDLAWLAERLAEPGFRGYAWINAHDELRPASEAVRAEVRSYKQHSTTRSQCGSTTGLAVVEPVFLFAEGTIVTAGINGAPARHASAAVATLLETP